MSDSQNYLPLMRAFAASLRSKEKFHFLQNVFHILNKHYFNLTRQGRPTPTYFLDTHYQVASLTDIWKKIEAIYERGYGPVKTVASEQLANEADFEELKSILLTIYPDQESAPSQEMWEFVRYFSSRGFENLEGDFQVGREHLEVVALKVANNFDQDELAQQRTDPMAALRKREERVKEVKAIFSSASATMVSSASDEMMALLSDPSRHTRKRYYSGDGILSMDHVIKGFHGKGLNVVLGGTSGGKTLVKAAICANYCLRPLTENVEAVKIWGYILEDGIDEYTSRICSNLINRDEIQTAFELDETFSPDMIKEMLYAATLPDRKNEIMALRAYQAVDFIFKNLMNNLSWLKGPSGAAQKLSFNVISMLDMFDAKLDTGESAPEFIVIDYFNHLELPRAMSSGNIPKDLSKIAHLLDEWGDTHNIPIITSVQSSISGIIKARDMEFFGPEDLHECKSIAHHARQLVSIMPVKHYNEDLSMEMRMGFKFLKNRGGIKDVIFLSDLNFNTNKTLTSTQLYSDIQWNQYIDLNMSRRAEATESVFDSPGAAQTFGSKKAKSKSVPGKGTFGAAKKPEVATESISIQDIDDSLI